MKTSLRYTYRMEPALIVLNILIAVGIVVLAVILVRRKSEAEKPAQPDGSLQLLLQQMNELNRTVDRRVQDLTKTVDTKIHLG